MRPDAELVGRAEIFAGLDPADLAALALCFRGRRYSPGDVVFREGEPGATLLLVGEGALSASQRTAAGPRPIGRYGPGQVIGAAAMVERAPRPATLTALIPTVLYELDADTVELLRPTAPAAARALKAAGLTALLRRLRHLEQRVERELDRDAIAPAGRGSGS